MRDGKLLLETKDGCTLEATPGDVLGTDLFTLVTSEGLHYIGHNHERLKLDQVARIDP